MIKHLYTPYGENFDKNLPLKEYPRPRLQRNNWINLNGAWDFFTTNGCDKIGKITVPYCVESLLSGINETFEKDTVFNYERTFFIDEDLRGKRVILHFGAVDQIAEVYINGLFVGKHEGILPFSFDVTDYVGKENLIKVIVKDDLIHKLPWGKQKVKRGGMWYTPVSGIWQTVWIEVVPDKYIKDVQVVCDKNQVTVSVDGVEDGKVIFEKKEYDLIDGKTSFSVEFPEYWSPETPRLYYFTVVSGEDKVESYFALRKLEVKTINGKKRLCLNGQPYFFHGLLDQGYYSDGIYTPADEQCVRDDILKMKRLGFNTLRKHIKVEPERFYYECDRLGMVVFQDMVNCGDYSFFGDTVLPTVGVIKRNDIKKHKDKETRDNFIKFAKETVNSLKNHPCICYWTIFNEGWGQFCADELYDIIKNEDSTRFIDSTSGWFKRNKSDVESLHIYFKKLKIGKDDKPQVLSEFGGYSYKSEGHSANEKKTYGYKKFTDINEFKKAVFSLYNDEVLPLVKKGLCAAIYTQLSDVEDETNGILTYDRKVQKIEKEEFFEISQKLKNAVLE